MSQPPLSLAVSSTGTQSPVDIAPAPSVNAQGKKRANDEDGEGGENGAKAKRNRKPVSCAQCRRRKLKCDRGYPCGACRDRQEGHLCEWDGAIRLPQPHLTRDAEAQELRLQLDRLEGLLGLVSNNPAALIAAAAAGGTPVEGGPSTGVAEKSAAEALGLLAANPPATSGRIVSPGSQCAGLLHGVSTVSHLVTLLPMKKELKALVSRFLTSEIVFFPIVHVPTFNSRIQAYTNATAPEHPFLLALLLAIVAHEMGWQLTDPSLSRVSATEKEHTSKRFIEAASEALRMGGFMDNPNLDVVRTLLVLHRVAEQQLDARASYYLSQAVQVAHTLGLNRDPGNLGQFDRIEVEERRKIWHMLVGLDWIDTSARASTITTTQYDTEEPANAYDTEITETSCHSRSFPTFTPWLYFHLHNQISTYAHAISEEVYAVKPHRQLTLGRIAELNQGLEALSRTLPLLEWVGDTVEPLPEDKNASDRFRVQAHSAILQLTIRLNRPFLTRGLADDRLKDGRMYCLEAAHKLLGIPLGYPEKHAITRLPLVTHHALNAMLIVALDLFLPAREVHSALSDFYADDPQGSSADKNRRLIANISMRLSAREHRSKAMQEVVRIVGVLVRAATRPSDDCRLPTTVGLSTTPLPPTFAFSRPLPLPMTLDPFSSFNKRSSEAEDSDLRPLWDALVALRLPTMYGAPDRREWEELSQGGKPWARGVDLVASPLPSSGSLSASTSTFDSAFATGSGMGGL
ncbi:hypothetical protein JCM11641_003769 [Rhodosporidiobolus odoratus]